MNSRVRNIVAIVAAVGGAGLLVSDLLPAYDEIGGRSRALYSTARGIRPDRDGGEGDLPQFNRVNPHEDWCPDADCRNSPMCQPCRRRFLVIISTGRSGSTSLMSMLNLLPGVRISGENNNELRALGGMVSNYADHPMSKLWHPPDEDETEDPSQWKDVDGRTAWGRNFIPPGSLSCPVQSMIEAINPPPLSEQLRGTAGEVTDDDIIGFKTIRFLEGWHDGDRNPTRSGGGKNGAGYLSIKRPLKFFLEHFPCSRVVVNIRSDERGLVDSYRKTAGFEGNDVSGGKMGAETRMLRTLTKRMGPTRAKLMDLSEWGNDPAKFTELAEWLGFRGCTYRDVLHSHDNHNYWPDERNIDLGPTCRYMVGNATSVKKVQHL